MLFIFKVFFKMNIVIVFPFVFLYFPFQKEFNLRKVQMKSPDEKEGVVGETLVSLLKNS